MEEAYEALSEISKAFAHPTRLRILELLSVDEACVCHLTHILDKRQAYVSQQLGVLRDAGLVDVRREGQMIYYRLTDARAAGVLSLLKDVALGVNPELRYDPVPRVPVMGCPCPKCSDADACCCTD